MVSTLESISEAREKNPFAIRGMTYPIKHPLSRVAEKISEQLGFILDRQGFETLLHLYNNDLFSYFARELSGGDPDDPTENPEDKCLVSSLYEDVFHHMDEHITIGYWSAYNSSLLKRFNLKEVTESGGVIAIKTKPYDEEDGFGIVVYQNDCVYKDELNNDCLVYTADWISDFGHPDLTNLHKKGEKIDVATEGYDPLVEKVLGLLKPFYDGI